MSDYWYLTIDDWWLIDDLDCCWCWCWADELMLILMMIIMLMLMVLLSRWANEHMSRRYDADAMTPSSYTRVTKIAGYDCIIVQQIFQGSLAYDSSTESDKCAFRKLSDRPAGWVVTLLRNHEYVPCMWKGTANQSPTTVFLYHPLSKRYGLVLYDCDNIAMLWKMTSEF